jgi:hypothetical protein
MIIDIHGHLLAPHFLAMIRKKRERFRVARTA